MYVVELESYRYIFGFLFLVGNAGRHPCEGQKLTSVIPRFPKHTHLGHIMCSIPTVSQHMCELSYARTCNIVLMTVVISSCLYHNTGQTRRNIMLAKDAMQVPQSLCGLIQSPLDSKLFILVSILPTISGYRGTLDALGKSLLLSW